MQSPRIGAAKIRSSIAQHYAPSELQIGWGTRLCNAVTKTPQAHQAGRFRAPQRFSDPAYGRSLFRIVLRSYDESYGDLLVCGGPLERVDHQHRDRPLGAFEAQPKLLIHCREQARSG